MALIYKELIKLIKLENTEECLSNKRISEICTIAYEQKINLKEFNIINSFEDKTIDDYLKAGAKKILIYFNHGLGDVIMFAPAFKKLKEKYPNAQIDFLALQGVFPGISSVNDYKGITLDYEYVFIPSFPSLTASSSKLKKGVFSAKYEVGVEIDEKLCPFKYIESPIVLLHFQSSSDPHLFNCDMELAKKIWNEVIDYGKIPMETQFIGAKHNEINQKFDFINNTTRSAKAKVSSLIGLIQNSYALIGINSGSLITSASINKYRTACLNTFKGGFGEISRFIDLPKNNIIDVENYRDGMIYEWLNSLKNLPLTTEILLSQK